MENFKKSHAESSNLYKNFSHGPYAPETTKSLEAYSDLSSIKEALTESFIDPATEVKINAVIEGWLSNPQESEPISEMKNILDEARKIPAGEERIKVMNTIVRTLGQPETLATYLDMLRDSATRLDTTEHQLCKNTLQNVRMHSIYGWCGNTLLSESGSNVVEGTYKSDPELGQKLGNSPAAWNLTMHIWQPNTNATGFPIGAELPPGTILEPPHSHPFSFVSRIVKGDIHQNIYEQKQIEENVVQRTGYYDGEVLEHVDGVWPPHNFNKSCALKTCGRVLLSEGDSYYMPCDWIHDVEIDGNLAKTKPSISLFLSSEYLVMPHVYMTKEMLDYQTENPDVKQTGTPIDENAWHKKLELLSAYLRGDSETLNLNEIVKHGGTYAFFNVNK